MGSLSGLVKAHQHCAPAREHLACQWIFDVGSDGHAARSHLLDPRPHRIWLGAKSDRHQIVDIGVRDDPLAPLSTAGLGKFAQKKHPGFLKVLDVFDVVDVAVGIDVGEPHPQVAEMSLESNSDGTKFGRATHRIVGETLHPLAFIGAEPAQLVSGKVEGR